MSIATVTRKIGDTVVPAIGFGAMGLSAYYGKPQPDEERFKVLDAVYARGVRHWDTANAYMDSEDLIGRWFKRTGKRDEIFLATKFGMTDNGVNGSPEHVRECIEQSLKTLGVDHVDLYYAHRSDPKVPIEHTVGAMAELVKEGKVKYLGLSECTASTLERAHKVHPITAIQVEYSPFALDIEDPKIAVLAKARELGVKIVAYSPLGRGLLTGQFKSPDDFEEGDGRRWFPRFSRENFPKVLKLSKGLADVGKAHGATAGQVSLAWLLAQGDDIIPIPGTTKIKYLEENVSAANVKLTPQDLEDIRQAAKDADASEGDRYPPGYEEQLFVETPQL
ncbi:Aldo/keto reductase [Athelia psychrophila]|uniref:Aldo/keto reductase n=1 Tax=Athelia psychrophila TaxID=1759441 RepID=A0A166G759_9AGAM|nr:Aldo/keto reductase [Fibularhizoctonia sp. CBS 109695]